MIAKIVVSSSLDLRSKHLLEILEKEGLTNNHPDLLYLGDSEKLGVEAAKKIRQHLSLRPYSAKGRGVVLESAHNLTMDAQNALLKTLEEPPLEAVIILGVDKEDSLLPTVLSRCEVVRLEETERQSGKEIKKFDQDIEKLIGLSIPGRFTFIEKLEEKEEFLGELIQYFREKLKKEPKKYLKISKLLLEAEEWKKSNVNIRAILEYLMLEMPELSDK